MTESRSLMASVPFSLRLDEEIKTRLKKEAKEMNRSESFVAATAIQEYLTAREHERRMIDEAVEQADKGVFVSSAAMGAWVDSWGSENELKPPKTDVRSK